MANSCRSHLPQGSAWNSLSPSSSPDVVVARLDPAGKYAKIALESLGVWPSVSSKIASAEDVRATLLLVARRRTPLGIVYQTDVLGVFPEWTCPPIIYPVAVTMTSTNPQAFAYINFLRSATARPAFEFQSFVVLQ